MLHWSRTLSRLVFNFMNVLHRQLSRGKALESMSAFPRYTPDQIQSLSAFPRFTPDQVAGLSGFPRSTPDQVLGLSGFPRLTPSEVSGLSGFGYVSEALAIATTAYGIFGPKPKENVSVPVYTPQPPPPTYQNFTPILVAGAFGAIILAVILTNKKK
jgi:hypothetical protein